MTVRLRAEVVGWDHPDTARAFERFQRHSDRYRFANRALASRAALRPGLRVLDLGAGDGGTQAEALPYLGEHDSILCVEPARAMRDLGRATVRDERVAWAASIPDTELLFDRVLCGAAIWQMPDLPRILAEIHGLLRPEGVLAFDVPGVYLGEPDPPGGGRDPHLLELPRAIAAEVRSRREHDAWNGTSGTWWATPGEPPPDRSTITETLEQAGFQARSWGFSFRFRQPEYREWLKIPPTTDGLLRGVPPRERERIVDRAYRLVDEHSWRWERWVGWTARKRP